MCGRHRSRVLAGEHQLVRDAEKLLQSDERDAEELGRLAEFLRASRERGDPVDEIRERAQGEVPELSGLVGALLDARTSRVEVATWHALLIATLRALEEGQAGESDESLKPSRIVYDSVNRYNVTTVQPSSTTEEPGQAVHKVGRNDPCPCGSGKKYKKCHGSPTGGAATP